MDKPANENRGVFKHFFWCLCLAICTSRAAESDSPSVDLRPIKQWIAKQDKIHSLAADFVQTRAFHSLRDPLVSSGRFWFVAPVSFRWEIGNPPRMLSVRKKEVIYLIQPSKKKAQRYSVEQLRQQTNPALFRFPLARDFDDFQRQFDVSAVRVEGNRCRAEVTPKEPTARKLLTLVKFDFDTDTGELFAVEMNFKDGTSMRNEFNHVQINPKVDPALFDYDLTGFQITAGGHS